MAKTRQVNRPQWKPCQYCWAMRSKMQARRPFTVAGHDFEIKQSPAILQSKREGGTTGAAVWQTSVRFAEWMNWKENPLLKVSVVNEESIVLELGSGISGIVPCVLGSKVRKTVATDQPYLLKTLRENIEHNNKSTAFAKSNKHNAKSKSRTQPPQANIEILPLDWETDDVASLMTTHALGDGVDLIVACDCIFNYSLIEPFVQTCVDIAGLRNARTPDATTRPTFCIVAQHLRQPEVFEQWLEVFLPSFRTWRMPDEVVTDGLKLGSGFVVHLGVLRLAS